MDAFFSDFWLLYHLSGPACMSCHGPCCLVVELTIFIMIGTGSPNSFWLTCEELKDTTKEYTKYVHGDPRKGRYVVIDKTVLPAIEIGGNLRVVLKELLLNRFIKALE